jgi:hypothetical protein
MDVLPAFALPIMDFGDFGEILLCIHGTKAVRRKVAKGGVHGEFGGLRPNQIYPYVDDKYSRRCTNTVQGPGTIMHVHVSYQSKSDLLSCSQQSMPVS